MFYEIHTSEKINETDERKELDKLYLELANTFIGNRDKIKKLLKRIDELENKSKNNFNPDVRIEIF